MIVLMKIKYVRKIVTVIQNLLFVVMLLVAGLVVLNQTYWKQKYRFYTVLSGSMEPALHVGSIVVVTAKQNYQVGDIVTAQIGTNGKQTVTHRIFSIDQNDREEQIMLKGDANEDPDLSLLTHKQIVGAVVFSIPFIGKIIEYSKTQQGFIFIVVIPATIFAYHEVLSMIEEVRKIGETLKSKIQKLKSKGKKEQVVEDMRHKTQKSKKMRVIGKKRNRES